MIALRPHWKPFYMNRMISDYKTLSKNFESANQLTFFQKKNNKSF